MASSLISSRTRYPRSEEYTSELQSPVHLVCRLLLEKKKPTRSTYLQYGPYLFYPDPAIPQAYTLSLHDALPIFGTGKRPQRESNISVLPEMQREYCDLLRAADVIIAKPGYGIVADIIAHQVPEIGRVHV